jgi:hypothetical protein
LPRRIIGALLVSVILAVVKTQLASPFVMLREQ